MIRRTEILLPLVILIRYSSSNNWSDDYPGYAPSYSDDRRRDDEAPVYHYTDSIRQDAAYHPDHQSQDYRRHDYDNSRDIDTPSTAGYVGELQSLLLATRQENQNLQRRMISIEESILAAQHRRSDQYQRFPPQPSADEVFRSYTIDQTNTYPSRSAYDQGFSHSSSYSYGPTRRERSRSVSPTSSRRTRQTRDSRDRNQWPDPRSRSRDHHCNMLHVVPPVVVFPSNHIVLVLSCILVFMTAIIETSSIHPLLLFGSRLAFTISVVCTARLLSACPTTMNPDTDLVSSDVSTQTDVLDDDLDVVMPVLDDSAIIDESQHPDDTPSEVVMYLDDTTVGSNLSDLTADTHLADRLPIVDSLVRKSLDIHTPAPTYKPILVSPPYLRQAEFYMDSGCTNHITHDISILHDVVLRGNSFDIGMIHGCVPGASVTD